MRPRTRVAWILAPLIALIGLWLIAGAPTRWTAPGVMIVLLILALGASAISLSDRFTVPRRARRRPRA